MYGMNCGSSRLSSMNSDTPVNRPIKKLKRLSPQGSPEVISLNRRIKPTTSAQDQSLVRVNKRSPIQMSVMKNYQHLQTEVERLKKEIKDLKQKCSKTPEETHGFITEENNKMLRKEIEDLTKTVTFREKNLRNVWKQAKIHKQNKLDEVNALENEYEKLESEIEKIKSNPNIKKLEEENRQIERQCNEHRDQNIRLTTEIGILLDKFEEYEKIKEKEANPPKSETEKWNEDPFHLSIHDHLKFTISDQKCSLWQLTKKQNQLKEHLSIYQKKQAKGRKEKYILQGVSRALLENFSLTKIQNLPPAEKEEEFFKEINEFEEGVKKKVEEKYEELQQQEQPGWSKESAYFLK